MAALRGNESPPPYSFSTSEELDGTNPYTPMKILATKEVDELFLSPILMLKFSTGVFLSGSFMILAGIVSVTVEWDALAIICFIFAGGVMSGPLWAVWQKNEVKEAHAERFIANYLETPEKARQNPEPGRTDRDKKVKLDADLEKQERINKRDRMALLNLLYVPLFFIGWLVTTASCMTVMIGLPKLPIDFSQGLRLHRTLNTFFFSLWFVTIGFVLMLFAAGSSVELSRDAKKMEEEEAELHHASAAKVEVEAQSVMVA